MSGTQRGDLIGKTIGIVVFFIGVGLLLLVFKLAYGLFSTSPAVALGLHITGDPKRDPGAALIGQAFGYLLVKILLLFAMSVAASFIAQKGINLFFSCAHGVRRGERSQATNQDALKREAMSQDDKMSVGAPATVIAPVESHVDASRNAKP